MAYSGSIIRRAEERLEQDRQAHRARRAALRQEILTALPRAGEIERELRATVPAFLAILGQKEAGPEALERLRKQNLDLQEEEARLLAGHGFPADGLDDVPLCPLCGDRGWKGMEMCQCLKGYCRQEQIKDLSSMLDLGEQSFETFDLSFYSREQDPRMKRSPRSNMEAVWTVCRDYAQQFGTYAHRNLLLFGAPGLGKTFLSASIARVVAEQGNAVVYDTAANLFSRFETRKFSRDGESLKQAESDARRYLTCDLLILDDLGSEFATPFVQSALYEVVNARLIGARHTVISTNLDRSAIRERYSPQVASRLEGEYAALFFFGEDIRQQKKRRKGTKA